MEVIFNKNKSENHFEKLKTLISKSDEMVFCSGWVKIEGLKLLAKELELATKRNASITIITNKEHTDEACVEFLKKYNVKHIIVDSSCRYFHTKMYYFTSGDSYHVIVGSANLTSGALKSNEELSLLISGNILDNYHEKITQYLGHLYREYLT